jgi:hypothetical protein
MPLVPFTELPDSARVWVFAAAEPIDPATADALTDHVQSFITGWLAHGRPVYGAFDWKYNQFLFIAADEAASGVSGCSIDSLFRSLQALEKKYGLTLLDSSPVWYRDEAGAISTVSRPEFKFLAESGDVGSATVVFDNSVANVGALRNGGWERAAAESWHGKAFLTARR